MLKRGPSSGSHDLWEVRQLQRAQGDICVSATSSDVAVDAADVAIDDATAVHTATSGDDDIDNGQLAQLLAQLG